MAWRRASRSSPCECQSEGSYEIGRNSEKPVDILFDSFCYDGHPRLNAAEEIAICRWKVSSCLLLYEVFQLTLLVIYLYWSIAHCNLWKGEPPAENFLSVLKAFKLDVI